MYADFVKIEYASDALLLILKKKLELLAYRAYSQILFKLVENYGLYEILKDRLIFMKV